MKYTYWTLRNGTLLIEKYEGNISKETIIENDNNLYDNVMNSNTNLLNIVDISNAIFSNIGFGEISELFESIELYSDKTKGMNLALYCYENTIEDFLKASAYSKHGVKFNIDIKCFVSFDPMIKWLGVTKEASEIRKLLAIN